MQNETGGANNVLAVARKDFKVTFIRKGRTAYEMSNLNPAVWLDDGKLDVFVGRHDPYRNGIADVAVEYPQDLKFSIRINFDVFNS